MKDTRVCDQIDGCKKTDFITIRGIFEYILPGLKMSAYIFLWLNNHGGFPQTDWKQMFDVKWKPKLSWNIGLSPKLWHLILLEGLDRNTELAATYQSKTYWIVKWLTQSNWVEEFINFLFPTTSKHRQTGW